MRGHTARANPAARRCRGSQVGDALVAYLDPPPQQLGPDRLRRMRFCASSNGTFRDVTEDVVAGRIPIKLR